MIKAKQMEDKRLMTFEELCNRPGPSGWATRSVVVSDPTGGGSNCSQLELETTDVQR